MENKEELKGNLAIIRVRGVTGLKKEMKDTMNLLRLYKKNFCVVVPNNEKYSGMVKKVKDYVTWGEISSEVFNLLVEKRGEEYKGREKDSKGKIRYSKFMEIGGRKIKKFFRLNMPKKVLAEKA